MSMTPKPWVVAYNLPTRSWTSGGTRKDYEYPHYDVFVVEAHDRDHAEKLGKLRRRAQMALTGPQRILLDCIKQEIASGGEEVRGYSIEISLDERRQARALVQKGLLRFANDDEHRLEVFLQPDAFNPSLDPDDIRLARATEFRLERRTAPAMGRKSKPGRL